MKAYHSYEVTRNPGFTKDFNGDKAVSFTVTLGIYESVRAYEVRDAIEAILEQHLDGQDC